MIKRILGLAFLAGMSLFLVREAAAVGINVTPPRVEVAIPEGEERMGYVSITNFDEKEPIRVKVYIQDIVYLPDGSNDFMPPNSTPWSFADWIKVGPTELDIGPGKQEVVRYLISVPKGVTGGRYGVIFFEMVIPPAKIKEIGANVTMRLGTLVLVAVKGTEIYKAKITDIRAQTPKRKEPLTITCNVKNEGNILVRPVGTVKIIDADKKLVAEVAMNPEKTGVLPDTARKFVAAYDAKLPKGTYYAQVVLDYGGEKLLGGQIKFTI